MDNRTLDRYGYGPVRGQLLRRSLGGVLRTWIDYPSQDVFNRELAKGRAPRTGAIDAPSADVESPPRPPPAWRHAGLVGTRFPAAARQGSADTRRSSVNHLAKAPCAAARAESGGGSIRT